LRRYSRELRSLGKIIRSLFPNDKREILNDKLSIQTLHILGGVAYVSAPGIFPGWAKIARAASAIQSAAIDVEPVRRGAAGKAAQPPKSEALH
jgi:hypothetical protein